MSHHGGISSKGRRELATIAGEKGGLVTVDEASARLGLSTSSTAKKLARWAKLGWLRRVRRGLYLVIPASAEDPAEWSTDPLLVAAVLWAPCFATGWTTANHWALSDQVFRTTVIKTCRRVRSSSMTLIGNNYLLTHIPGSELWGTTPAWIQGQRVELADPARTVIDVMDRPGLAGGIRHAADILIQYIENHEWRQLVTYAKRLDNRAVFKRLGFLVSHLGIESPELIGECRRRISKGMSRLDPDARGTGYRDPDWNLRINVNVQGGA
jgi:predicted transcriptional regulator of viral defense system